MLMYIMEHLMYNGSYSRLINKKEKRALKIHLLKIMPVSLNVIQILSGDAAYSSTSNELYILRLHRRAFYKLLWVLGWLGQVQ